MPLRCLAPCLTIVPDGKTDDFIKLINLFSKTDDLMKMINLFNKTDDFIKNDKLI